MLEFLTDWSVIIYSIFVSEYFLSGVNALVATGAGAIAGGLVVHRRAERDRLHREYIRELEALNVITALLFDIVSTYISLKNQHVAGICERYYKNRATVEQKLGRSKEIEVDFELTRLEKPFSNPEKIINIIIDGTKISDRTLSAISTFFRCKLSLDNTIDRRNIWIEEFRKSNDHDSFKCFRYFGFPYENNSVDNEFRDCIDALGASTDDCIAFPMIAINDLGKYGDDLLRKFKGSFGDVDFKLKKISFENIENPEILPSMTDYEDWLKAFKSSS
ncbi:MAG: hypothetical protein JJ878_19105 [Alphaproteobacteria bacterium]|nr:hypothetical protein [Alphaproteobacteria bacterium]